MAERAKSDKVSDDANGKSSNKQNLNEFQGDSEELRAIRKKYYSMKDTFVRNVIAERKEEAFFECLSLADEFAFKLYHKEYSTTKNTLFLWSVVSHCRSLPINRYACLDPKVDLESYIMRPGHEHERDAILNSEWFIENQKWFLEMLEKSPKTIPIPDFCQEYLGECAFKMMSLIRDEAVSPRQIVGKIPNVFGFILGKKNFFHSAKALAWDSRLRWRLCEVWFREASSKEEAYKVIAEEFGFQDTRSVKRIISSMERGRGKT